jgi:hypothetical protein
MAGLLGSGVLAAGNYAPVAFGAAENTPGVTGLTATGILGAIASAIGGVFAVLKSGGASQVIRGFGDVVSPIIGGPKGTVLKDATDLLPLIAKNEGGLEASAVRVALFTLEIHCAIRKPDRLDQVHALAKDLLVLQEPKA